MSTKFMKGLTLAGIVLVLVSGLLLSSYGQGRPESAPPAGDGVAPTPPMGWNSYDAFGSTVDESQFKAEVDFMKSKLLRYGWKYAVIDYLWFNPTGGPNIRLGTNGEPIDTLAMDGNGRLLPAVNRFPSAAGLNGFKLIAEYTHAMGLKFGIHIMRGIPRQAYWINTPILGTSYSAREIADTTSSNLCPWNNNMYGLDPQKPGAQVYYNSVFNLYAEWGVDLVKVDDIARPYHIGEIEIIRKAIDQCGRPMVLSLSPGETPVSQAEHVSHNANMWRLSDDMWDSWKDLRHGFELLNTWSPYIQKDHWPDADMLPIGHLSLNGKPNGPDRMSRFTKDETFTLLTLWCIARSPLMMGGELLTTPAWVISLLQNGEVLAVDQSSTGNHQVMRDDSEAVWIADGPGTGNIYVALFNLDQRPRIIDFRYDSVTGLKGTYLVRDLWKNEDVGKVIEHFTITLGPHGAGLFRLTDGQ
jgi:alpha-galactosidase